METIESSKGRAPRLFQKTTRDRDTPKGKRERERDGFDASLLQRNLTIDILSVGSCISSALGIVTKGLEQVLLWLSCLGGVVLSVLLTGFAARSLVVFVSGQCVRDRGIA